MDTKWTSGNELKYLKQVLDNAKEVRDNAFTDRLESAFKKKYNVKYAIALNSGASGLHAAMHAIDLKPGDEMELIIEKLGSQKQKVVSVKS